MKERLERILDSLRARSSLVDHAVRSAEHYVAVNGSGLAAAVTYFAFLSIFPILALAFAVIGFISSAYPEAEDALVEAINSVLPGLVGGSYGLPLATFRNNAPSVLSIGIVVALYSGLKWLSGMRKALGDVFEQPRLEQPGFVMGKLRDVVAMLTLGVVLLLSVTVSGVLTRVSRPILELVGLDESSAPLLWVLALALGIVFSTLLFLAFFKVLAAPQLPWRALWAGAVLGAVAFEVLKQFSSLVVQATRQQPAVQVFGIALVLLIWINYTSRVVIFSAAWAHTTAGARMTREAAQPESELPTAGQDAVGGPGVVDVVAGRGSRTAFAAGAVSMLAFVAAVSRTRGLMLAALGRTRHDGGGPRT